MDGDLDVDDIDALTAEAIAGTNDPDFDLNNDAVVDGNDRRIWIEELKNTYFGDSNLDGEFSSSDFVAVFTTAKYETGQAAQWDEGDWNGDGLFGSSDFVAAFTAGGYEKGPRQQANAVPEPSMCFLLLTGLFGLLKLRR
jgi:hypothetical protein